VRREITKLDMKKGTRVQSVFRTGLGLFLEISLINQAKSEFVL